MYVFFKSAVGWSNNAQKNDLPNDSYFLITFTNSQQG